MSAHAVSGAPADGRRADRRPADVAVIGLGIHGAAAVFEFAQRGLTVIGIDAQTPPAGRGSSNGRTRIIREAYFEHPLYVPLVQRAYELWSGLEELTGTVLYRQTGGVSAGPANSVLVRGALASAREHDIEHELLDAEQLRRRFPALLPQPDHVGVVERRAGVLLVEPCIRTLLQLAHGHGAILHTDTRVESWHADAGGVVIATTNGTIHARQLVIAAGPWLNKVLLLDTSHHTTHDTAHVSQSQSRPPSPSQSQSPTQSQSQSRTPTQSPTPTQSQSQSQSQSRTPSQSPLQSPLQLPLTTERQVPHWFAPAAGRTEFNAAVCPVTILEYESGRYIYTLPDVGSGVKAGIHHEGVLVDPDDVDLAISMHEETRLRLLLDSWMPGAAERVLDATVCLYTNTPDEHFLIDFHPSHGNVLLLSACSGHGFKFAPAIGEVVADLVIEGGSWADVGAFRIARF